MRTPWRVSWIVVVLVVAWVVTPCATAAPDDDPPRLASAPELEHRTLTRLLSAPAWPRRALGAMRLERYREDPESRALLESLCVDGSWQVRCFALRAIARRGEDAPPGVLEVESDPRVVRTAVRHGLRYDPERLANGYRHLCDSRDVSDQVLGAELAAAAGDEQMREDASEVVRRVILRLGRTDAARVSPRLAALTGAPDLRTPLRWQRWLRRDSGRRVELRTGPTLRGGGPTRIAGLDPEQFAALESYLVELGRKPLDLAVCLDCTASMSGEIDAARGGVDDLIVFVDDIVADLRVGLVAYRDRRDRDFETRAWDFTRDPQRLREALWQLSAYGGGDSPEAVHPALELAYTRLTWLPESRKVLVLIGDAPPHVGLGTPCIEMAARAAEAEVSTHTIEAKGKPVDHFAEIAQAGGGQCVALADDDLLMGEIAGFAMGDRFEEEFRELFAVYLALCR